MLSLYFIVFVVFVKHIEFFFYFFFQADDGIRDADVTGVQTCALPICPTAVGNPLKSAKVTPLTISHRNVPGNPAAVASSAWSTGYVGGRSPSNHHSSPLPRITTGTGTVGVSALISPESARSSWRSSLTGNSSAERSTDSVGTPPTNSMESEAPSRQHRSHVQPNSRQDPLHTGVERRVARAVASNPTIRERQLSSSVSSAKLTSPRS